jgi:hypothetical protein
MQPVTRRESRPSSAVGAVALAQMAAVWPGGEPDAELKRGQFDCCWHGLEAALETRVKEPGRHKTGR